MTKESKPDRLRQMGALNPRPEGVRAPWFREASFFGPLDLVQVKYEMLRHAREDGTNKADAAALFGLSRQTYYQAEAAFERDGMSGLLPRTRGAEVSPQAYWRGHAPRRGASRCERPTAGPLSGGPCAFETGHQRPSSQHRTRGGA